MAISTKTNRARDRKPRRWTARELLRLPPEKREPILAAAAAAAEAEYRSNRELNAFETYGSGDLYGDSANSEPR